MSSSTLADFFADPASWLVVASGQAEGRLTLAEGPDGKPALRLDYDFHGGGGFVVARKEIQLALPETFQLGFSLHGEGPTNHFEFKVADPGGSNAWRCQLPDAASRRVSQPPCRWWPTMPPWHRRTLPRASTT